jgi:hypothetical protein
VAVVSTVQHVAAADPASTVTLLKPWRRLDIQLNLSAALTWLLLQQQLLLSQLLLLALLLLLFPRLLCAAAKPSAQLPAQVHPKVCPRIASLLSRILAPRSQARKQHSLQQQHQQKGTASVTGVSALEVRASKRLLERTSEI